LSGIVPALCAVHEATHLLGQLALSRTEAELIAPAVIRVHAPCDLGGLAGDPDGGVVEKLGQLGAVLALLGSGGCVAAVARRSLRVPAAGEATWILHGRAAGVPPRMPLGPVAHELAKVESAMRLISVCDGRAGGIGAVSLGWVDGALAGGLGAADGAALRRRRYQKQIQPTANRSERKRQGFCSAARHLPG